MRFDPCWLLDVVLASGQIRANLLAAYRHNHAPCGSFDLLSRVELSLRDSQQGSDSRVDVEMIS